jgi:hypothetical protein
MKQYLPTKNNIHLISLILLGFIGYQFSVATLLFFIGIGISKLSCWAILISYPLISGWYLYKNYNAITTKKELAILYCWSSLITIFSLLVSSYFIDYSYDGQSYHGEAIIQLASGWNPTKNYLLGDDIITLVINHFAKASWVNGAFFYKLTTVFECAKAANLILIFASFFIAYPFFNKWFSKITAIILACLIAFNPICINMYLSNMLDGQIASLMFIFFVLLYNYLEENKKEVLPFIYLLILYIINLKFTIVGYFGIFVVAISLYFLIKKQFAKKFIQLTHITIACGLATVVFGYNTYTKNTITHQHPFYPFKGTNAMTNSIVEAMDYKTGNKFINFVKSNFAASTFSECFTKPIKYKNPFTFSKYELERFAFAGVMIGGFGVWFSGAILISLGIFIWVAIKKRKEIFKNDFIFYFLIAVFLATILINPLGYVARYIPQYYLLPFLALLLFKKYYSSTIVIVILIFVLTINSILICGYTYYNFVATKTIKTQMKSIQITGKTVGIDFRQSKSKSVLFDEYKIKYHPLILDKNIIPDTLFRSEVVYKIDK